MAFLENEKLGPYRIREKIGAGGMGEVYRAYDERLDRDVAIKVLPPRLTNSPQSRRRFEREARAIFQLQHPGVCTLYDVGSEKDVEYLVLELLHGETLEERLERGALPLEEALVAGYQVAEAVAAAHEQNLVHRDLKPGNVMLTRTGTKVLDFGLARSVARPSTDSRAATAVNLTATGAVMGTAPYMSPEQLQGVQVDGRTDVWSIGCILFEMLTGTRPFQGDTRATLASKILTLDPEPPSNQAPLLPRALDRLVMECLEKKRSDRTATASGIAHELRSIEATLHSSGGAGASNPSVKTRGLLFAASVLAIGLIAVGGWLLKRAEKRIWAETSAVAEAASLRHLDRETEATDLLLAALEHAPESEGLLKELDRSSFEHTIESRPSGATVFYRTYSGHASAAWRRLGETPVTARIPRTLLEWRVEKQGYRPVRDATWLPSDRVRFVLHDPDDVPDGMVYVPASGDSFVVWAGGLDHLPEVEVPDFWIDETEVTNLAFKRFVDAGGYARPELWKEPFKQHGKTLTWKEAMEFFVDSTGKPGPATWELGTYPSGADEYPVSGVSWYEANAFAEFVGRELPTVHHWARVAAPETARLIVERSNFNGSGPEPVGALEAYNRHGAQDMAGNLREWCWNDNGAGQRYLMGGAFNDPTYFITDPYTAPPFERTTGDGFRTMLRSGSEPIPEIVLGQIVQPMRDLENDTPASDQVFEAYRSQFSYEALPLLARVEQRDTADSEWDVESVSFAAAYGEERVPGHLVLPKQATPPFQVVVMFPGADAIQSTSSRRFVDDVILGRNDWLVRGGRAVFLPVYKGTFERRGSIADDYPDQNLEWRDHVVMWSKDLGRAIDYLESRTELDSDKIAYLGLSWGAAMGAILPAVEPRLKAVVLEAGGLNAQYGPPEVDALNFAPRVTVPTLMINGRFDFFYPLESSQLPLFNLLGAPPEHKRHVVFEIGHRVPRTDKVRETAAWLDRYLGPVGN